MQDRPDAQWIDERIRLELYNPSWPAAFRTESSQLATLLGPWISGGIHHVGSTAIPGMTAKPVIDILVGVRSLDDSRPSLEILQKAGWCYSPYLPDEMHWFCKPDPSRRTHHLHLFPTGSDRYRDELTFRDYLLSHPHAAQDYAALKVALAAEFPDDREAYTEGKSDFVRGIIQAETVRKRR